MWRCSMCPAALSCGAWAAPKERPTGRLLHVLQALLHRRQLLLGALVHEHQRGAHLLGILGLALELLALRLARREEELHARAAGLAAHLDRLVARGLRLQALLLGDALKGHGAVSYTHLRAHETDS